MVDEAVIGESPKWCGNQRTLHRIDAKAPALYCAEVASLETTSWPSDIGNYAPALVVLSLGCGSAVHGFVYSRRTLL